MSVAVKQKVRFGPFEVNLSTGELSKNGTRLKLQPQPIAVLAALLQHPGELVTREELQRRLWPNDTFVDFEQGLNTAVKKLRVALCDEAETPKYIETLPKRGYRFIAQVQFCGEAHVPGQDPLIARRLSHYRIIERIGEGGMGVVYRAHDERLDRDVALKILPPGSLADDAARQRFRKEALVLSKLNHPNIATIFDFDSDDDIDFLVEELINGVSLHDMLAAGPLREKETVNLGQQLCEGLAVAHEHGIIHCDIKPGNLRITAEAHLKILDFGLAKTLHPPKQPMGESITVSEGQLISGTLPYMSPEQLRNEKLDGRSDIWAVGCVLYEMATGRKPFLGQGPALVDEILHQAPAQPSKLNHRVSPGLEAMTQKCLEKDPALRYRSARDIVVDLRRLHQAPSSLTLIPPPRPKPRRWLWLVAAVLLLAGAGSGIYNILKPQPQPRIIGSHVLTKTVSPKDDADLPFVDRGSIYFTEARSSGGFQVAVQIASGEVSAKPMIPGFWRDTSRDGTKSLSMAFDPGRNQWDAWTQALPAGTPRLVVKNVCDVIWSADGRSLLFNRWERPGLYRADADGTRPEQLTAYSWNQSCEGTMHLSPDGTRVRFTGPGPTFVLWEVGADGKNLHPMFGGRKDVFGGSWSPDGKYYFFRSWDGERWSLWAASETHRWWKKDDPSQLQRLTFGPMSFGVPAISKDGQQLYAVAKESRGELSIYEYKTHQFVPFLGGISACDVDFSRDGKWIAYVSYPEGTLWRSRTDGSERRQLTVPPLAVVNPRWSPDGKLIAFTDYSNGDRQQMKDDTQRRIYLVSADGGDTQLLVAGYADDPTWSPDGNSIVYSYHSAQPDSEVRILDLTTMKSTAITGSKGKWGPRRSPDGRFLVAQVGWPITSMDVFDFSRQTWQEVTGKGSGWPSWSSDSKSIYFLQGDAIFRVAILDRKTDPVASLKGFRGTTFFLDRWDGTWIGVTPDGRPLTTRDTGLQELYALDLEYK